MQNSVQGECDHSRGTFLQRKATEELVYKISTAGAALPFFKRTVIDPYFTSTTCHLPAASFIKIQNPIEVALALKIVTHMQCTFVVHSGGHSPSPGFASVGESGIVIDLGSSILLLFQM
jgi:hypothetical protein